MKSEKITQNADAEEQLLYFTSSSLSKDGRHLFYLKRRPFGYLLSSIIIIKGIAMLTSISAMIINSVLSGIAISAIEIAIFPAFNIVAVICLILLLKNVVYPYEVSTMKNNN